MPTSEYNEDIVYGVEIAVNIILRGSYTNEGVQKWWGRPRWQLDGKSPRRVVASDPDAVVKLALESLDMVAT